VVGDVRLGKHASRLTVEQTQPFIFRQPARLARNTATERILLSGSDLLLE
jgi:hypothetical protein